MQPEFTSNFDINTSGAKETIGANYTRDPSDQIVDTKNWIIKQSIWRADDDGHIIMTLENIMCMALLIQDKSGTRYTDVIAQFDQYNATQNNKGEHECYMDIYLLDTHGQTITTPYKRLKITRDLCRNLGTIKLDPVRLDAVFYPIAVGFGCSGKASWNYEGGC